MRLALSNFVKKLTTLMSPLGILTYVGIGLLLWMMGLESYYSLYYIGRHPIFIDLVSYLSLVSFLVGIGYRAKQFSNANTEFIPALKGQIKSTKVKFKIIPGIILVLYGYLAIFEYVAVGQWTTHIKLLPFSNVFLLFIIAMSCWEFIWKFLKLIKEFIQELTQSGPSYFKIGLICLAILSVSALGIYEYAHSTRVLSVEYMSKPNGANGEYGEIIMKLSEKPTEKIKLKAKDAKFLRYRIIDKVLKDATVEYRLRILGGVTHKHKYKMKIDNILGNGFTNLFQSKSVNIDIEVPPRLIYVTRTSPSVALNTITPTMFNNRVSFYFPIAIAKGNLNTRIEQSEIKFIHLKEKVDGYYIWTNERLLEFIFDHDKPKYNSTYTFEINVKNLINLDTDVWRGRRDDDTTPVVYKFTTSENSIFVQQINFEYHRPEWNSELVISFNDEIVDSLDILKDINIKKMGISLKPHINGKWYWKSSKELAFTPNSSGDWKPAWALETEYTLNISSKINTDKDRKWKIEHLPFTFKVPRKTNYIHNHLPRGTNVALDSVVELELRYPMLENEIARIRKGAQILIIEPKIDGKIEIVDKTKIKFYPKTIWREKTKYEVKLNTDVLENKYYRWDKNLRNNHAGFDFITKENVVALDLFHVDQNGTSVTDLISSKATYQISKENMEINPYDRLWIIFDVALKDKQKKKINLNDIITFSPALKTKMKWHGDNQIEIVPTQNMLPNTKYKMTVSKDIFYHPDQHFPDHQNFAEFHTKDDVVNVYGNSGKVSDDEKLKFNFNQNLKITDEIGREYPISNIKKSDVNISYVGDELYYKWTNKREFVLYPKVYWPVEKEINIEFNDGLLPNVHSKYLGEHKYHISTSKIQYDIAELPIRGRTVIGSKEIEVLFSKKVRPETSKIGDAVVDGVVWVSPAIDGKWRWMSDKKVKFTPEKEYNTSSTYTIHFDKKKIDPTRFEYVGEEEFSFYTDRLKIVDYQQDLRYDRNELNKVKIDYRIKYNYPVDVADFKKHISLMYYEKGNTVHVPFEVNAINNGDKPYALSFEVISEKIVRPADQRDVTLKISEGVVPAVGNDKTASDITYETVIDPPRKIEVKKFLWFEENGRISMKILLNSPVEIDEVQKYLKITHGDENLEYRLESMRDLYNSEYGFIIMSNFLPHQEYNFSLGKNMLAVDGAFLLDELQHITVAPNYNQSLRFYTQGEFISRNDMESVPIITRSIYNFNVIIRQIYANNVMHYINRDGGSSSVEGKVIYSKDYIVKAQNYDSDGNIITDLNLKELLKKNEHGMFQVCIEKNKNLYNYDKRCKDVVLTDIGMVARKIDNDFLVWTWSLEDGESSSGITVKAIDQWNQVVAQGKTNGNGFVKLQLDKNSYSELLIATKSNDWSYLNMNKHKNIMRGFDTEGISSKYESIKTFIYSDRGAYRPGDTVHLVFISRNEKGRIIEPTNLEFEILDSKGKRLQGDKYLSEKNGFYSYDFRIPEDSKTGKWKVVSSWQPKVGFSSTKEIGFYNFQVEEFIPNKIEVKISSLNSKTVRLGDTLKFKVYAKTLFGPPSANSDVEAKVNLRSFYHKPKQYPDYFFGHTTEEFKRIDFDFTKTKTDKNGESLFEYKIPKDIRSPLGLRAHIATTVIDDTGRGVAAYKEITIYQYDRLVGAKFLGPKMVEMNQKIGFSILNMTNDGKLVPRKKQKLSFELYRSRNLTHYKKNERGYFRYVTEKVREFYKALPDTRDDHNKLFLTLADPGEYDLVITDKLGKQVTEMSFEILGQRNDGQNLANMDKIQFKILNRRVKVGEKVKVEILSPFKGTLLLSEERSNVLNTEVIELDSQRKIVEIDVDEKHYPNFYLTGYVVRKVKKTSLHKPIYSFGLLNVKVENPKHNPLLSINSPIEARPNSKLSFEVEVSDRGGEEMYLTVAAVDEGVLQLTNFKTPDLKGYFDQNVRLAVQHFHAMDKILPYLPRSRNQITPSGDAPSYALIKKRKVNPVSQKRVQTVALWSGVVKFGKNNRAKVEFDVPDFNGTLRVMAVAFGQERFTSAEKKVIVKDRLVLNPAIPRFLATGDRFQIPVTIYNTTKTSGNVKVSVSDNGYINLGSVTEQTVSIPAGKKRRVIFEADVKKVVGLSDVKIVAEGLGEKTTKTTHVPVRSAGNYLLTSGSGSFNKNNPVEFETSKNYIQDSTDAYLIISASSVTRFKSSLDYLLRYPHGCMEQTTSKVFPLLYYADLADDDSLSYQRKKVSAEYYIKEGINKLEMAVKEDGSVPLWPGGGYHSWTTIYVAHFFVEAQKKGYKIDSVVWNNILHYLYTTVNHHIDNLNDFGSYRFSHAVYALYVLSLAEQNVLTSLNTLYSRYYESLKPHEKAMVATSYALLGQKDKATELLDRIGGYDIYKKRYCSYGIDFSSNTRDLALYLEALSTADAPEDKIKPILELLVSLSDRGHYYSTQDNAYALMAIGHASKKVDGDSCNSTVKIGDETIAVKGESEKITGPKLIGKKVYMKTDAENRQINYSWAIYGVEKNSKVLEYDKGIKVRRRLLSREGKPIDYNQIKQGDLVVAEIEVSSKSGSIANVVVTDLLPMGLEIENSRLKTSTKLDWIKENWNVDYRDIRDDRINFYGTIDESVSKVYYIARAVTVGDFKLPAIVSEAMYDPTLTSKAGDGKIKIIK